MVDLRPPIPVPLLLSRHRHSRHGHASGRRRARALRARVIVSLRCLPVATVVRLVAVVSACSRRECAPRAALASSSRCYREGARQAGPATTRKTLLSLPLPLPLPLPACFQAAWPGQAWCIRQWSASLLTMAQPR